jgi:hypothetical protein
MTLERILLNNLYCKLVYKINNKQIIKENINYNECYCCRNSNIKHIICKVVNSPHYNYVNGNKEDYINYMKNAGKYAGYGLEHGFDIFDKLIKEFSISKIDMIKCVLVDNKYIIEDGVHRISILLNLEHTHAWINVIS